MIDKTEAQQLLERIIFEEMQPQDWAQDVWDFNPIHGESAAKLLDVLTALVQISSPEKLEAYLHSLYEDRIDN
jgi:hypothetical protein